jgi:cysteinyl-tRNA synthetase
MIKDIIKNGFAYEVNGSVYFDVRKYNEQHHYGKLSGRVLDELLETTRDLDGQEEKRFKADFALWKKAEKGHIMKWPSPWSEGFPGWHLECSAMSTKYLGKTFDIHGGGMDLKFPHHECEIAQNVGACGHEPVRYWMHSNMLNFNGKKMSKSEGNVILPMQLIKGDHPLLDKGYSPMVVRFLFLQSHYSSELDISIKSLQDAEKGYRRLMKALDYLDVIQPDGSTLDASLDDEIQKWMKEIIEDLCDDFNTAKATAGLYALSAHINTFYHQGKSARGISPNTFQSLKQFYSDILLQVLGLKKESNKESVTLDNVIQVIINLRKQARAEKNWALSDKIRDDLKDAGIIIKDEKDGTTTYELAN